MTLLDKYSIFKDEYAGVFYVADRRYRQKGGTVINILVVDKDKEFLGTVVERIESELHFNVVVASTFAQTKEIFAGGKKQFFLALIDLSIPEVLNGEFVDLLSARDIPIVGLTSDVSDAIREYVSSMNILDYLIKQDMGDVEQIVSFIDRIYKNQSTKVMVVDDSKTSRTMTRLIFKTYRFQVLEAEDALSALKIFKDNQDIKLIITDYIMPEMDGVELIHQLRSKFKKGKGDLAILGISAFGSNVLSAKFIKNGANDFLTKPFLKEEFICRINQNIEYIENYRKIRELSEIDPLTGLYNRRFLYDHGDRYYANAHRGDFTLTVAMLDIDFFKKVNDTYGHAAGDMVLEEFGKYLKSAFKKPDLVSRFGGEEFCVLAINLEGEALEATFEKLRKGIEAIELDYKGDKIAVTASIGVSTEMGGSFENMVKIADGLLYEAKEDGRNIVKYSS